MSELGLIRPDMLEVVGRPYGVQVSHPVAASDIRKWARATWYPASPPPGYLEPEAEEEGRLVAPLDFNPYAWGAARSVAAEGAIPGEDRYRAVGAVEHLLGITPPELFRALNGGVGTTYTTVRMRPGDVITSTATVAGYSEKAGRLGPMLLTDTETRWSNQHGEQVKTQRSTLIRY